MNAINTYSYSCWSYQARQIHKTNASSKTSTTRKPRMTETKVKPRTQ